MILNRPIIKSPASSSTGRVYVNQWQTQTFDMGRGVGLVLRNKWVDG